MSRVLALFFTVLLLCCGVSPVAATEIEELVVPTTRTFALATHESLWSDWKKLGQPRATWPKYWKDSCVLTRIPCTDKAWRHLPIGQIIVTPRSAKDIEADVQKQKKLLATANAENADRQLQMRLIEEKFRAEVDDARERVLALLVLCGVVLLVVLLASYDKFRDRKMCEEDACVDCMEPTLMSVSGTPSADTLDESSGVSDSDFSQPPSGTASTNSPYRDAYLPSDTPIATYPPKHVELLIPVEREGEINPEAFRDQPNKM